MEYYFAPMEGLTDHTFRVLHHKYFPGVDKYFTPFFSPTQHHAFSAKERREFPPADTIGFPVVPQLLTKNAEDFLWAAQTLRDLGYTEVNLNLGCPSGTVVSKGKGSGMLRDLWVLDEFLEKIFSQCVLPISVKSRLGLEAPEEFPKLLEVYNRYPMKQLQLHPRVRKAFYSGDVDMAAFRYCAENSTNPVCYNGNLQTRSDISKFSDAFPEIGAIMLGRGLLARPGLLCPEGTDAGKLQSFLQELLESYIASFGGARNAMFRMKEHWGFLLPCFQDSESLGKRLRKTTDVAEYRSIVQEIFATLDYMA